MKGVDELECRERMKACQEEVYRALGERVPWRTFVLILSFLASLAVGCYAFVWKTNGSVVESIVELKIKIGELGRDVQHVKENVEWLRRNNGCSHEQS